MSEQIKIQTTRGRYGKILAGRLPYGKSEKSKNGARGEKDIGRRKRRSRPASSYRKDTRRIKTEWDTLIIPSSLMIVYPSSLPFFLCLLVGSSANMREGLPSSSHAKESRFFSPPLIPLTLSSPTIVSAAFASPKRLRSRSTRLVFSRRVNEGGRRRRAAITKVSRTVSWE